MVSLAFLQPISLLPDVRLSDTKSIKGCGSKKKMPFPREIFLWMSQIHFFHSNPTCHYLRSNPHPWSLKWPANHPPAFNPPPATLSIPPLTGHKDPSKTPILPCHPLAKTKTLQWPLRTFLGQVPLNRPAYQLASPELRFRHALCLSSGVLFSLACALYVLVHPRDALSYCVSCRRTIWASFRRRHKFQEPFPTLLLYSPIQFVWYYFELD